jgi:hypothetical protein
MHKRDLGPMGEAAFKGWCHSAGLTVHKSEMDRTGWDFFVEFSPKQKDSLPRDMLPAPIECKVQVKATDKKEKKLPITVSNLDRLIKAQMPAFFCFIEFDGKNEAQVAYLVHVGKEIIKKTLKRIRELESEGNGEKLHNHKMTIYYGDSDCLADTTGDSLKRAIEKHIPDTVEKYIEDKNKLLKTLGFEDGKGQFTITVSGNDPVRDVVDLALGLRKEIYIDKSIFYHKRFGVLLNNSLLDSEEAILSITSKPTKVVLKFKEHQFSSGISFDADLYLSPLDQFVPKEYIKFRIKSNFFEFIVEPFNNKVIYSSYLQDSQRSPLNELRDYLKVLTLLQKASEPVIVEIEAEPENLPPPPFRISINDDIDDCSKIYQIAEMAISICRQFDISESKVFVTIDNLMQSARSIEVLHYFLYGDPKEVMINFNAEGEEYQQDSKAAYNLFIETVIGIQTMGCCIGILGYLTLIDEGQYRLRADELIMWRKLVAPENKLIEKEVINEEFDKFDKELQKKGIVILRRDLYGDVS